MKAEMVSFKQQDLVTKDYAYKLINRMTIYSLDELLFLFGTSLLFHVQFYESESGE